VVGLGRYYCHIRGVHTAESDPNQRHLIRPWITSVSPPEVNHGIRITVESGTSDPALIRPRELKSLVESSARFPGCSGCSG
jgi:hypothetical protein